MADPIQIRLLREADLGFADSVRAAAGWNQTRQDWRRLLAHDPEGCFLAEWNGRPAGTITTTAYSMELAWIGMLLVQPELRGRGIGQALLRHAIAFLTDRRIRCLKLDATPAGLPLYHKLGFKTEWTLRRWELHHFRLSQTSLPHQLRPARAADRDALVRLDAAALGFQRARWLLSLLEQSRRTLVWVNEAAEIGGFAILREGARALYLGPFVATSNEAAADLALATLSSARDQETRFWDVPDQNLAAQDLLHQHGFSQQRQLTRMYLGEPPPAGRVQTLFGISGPETG